MTHKGLRVRNEAYTTNGAWIVARLDGREVLIPASLFAGGALADGSVTLAKLAAEVAAAFAAAEHAHAGYAAAGHNHDGAYSAPGHTHDYAATGHNHDGAYAAAGHAHAGVYAPAAHNHDGSYAAANHNHDASYASIAALNAKANAAAVPNASYRTILDSSGSHTAGRTANTYGFAQGQPLAVTGTGTLYALNTIYINSADFPTLDGVAPKLRVRAQLYVNDVAPTGNFTFGLHPITRPATSGGAGLCIYTIGAAVAGSTIAQNTPAADSMNTVVGNDFALPANGHYVLAVVTTATVAANSHLHMSASLQMRNA